ncbi:hypothetical protein [Endozoicomonas sp. Mp262]|uniref:hypothetical protein n=1 Tax=Endozoicomonas sp. Mp262 TaxID=2919499 RepID=UPI0021DA2A79
MDTVQKKKSAKELFRRLLFLVVIDIPLVLISYNVYATLPCCAKRVYTNTGNKTKITGCQKVINCLYADSGIVFLTENLEPRLDNTSGYCHYCCPTPVYDKAGRRISDKPVSIEGDSQLKLFIGIFYQRVINDLLDKLFKAGSQKNYHIHPEGYLDKWLMPLTRRDDRFYPEMLIFPHQNINNLLDASQQVVPLRLDDVFPYCGDNNNHYLCTGQKSGKLEKPRGMS